VPLTAHNVPLPSPDELKKLCLTHNVLNYIINMMPCDNISNMVAIPSLLTKSKASYLNTGIYESTVNVAFNYFGM
jgi:hypothetical protein